MKLAMSNAVNSDIKLAINNKIKQVKADNRFTVDYFKVNKGISAQKVMKINNVLGRSMPLELKDFYSKVNGFELRWSFEDEKMELSGFWDFWSLERLLFGFDGEISKESLENPFEETFWGEDFEDKVNKELKEHRVVESVIGEDAYITCKISNDKVQLYYINEDRWKPIPLTLKDYALIIIESLGVGNVRVCMQKQDFLKKPLKCQDLNKLNAIIPIDNIGTHKK